MPRKRLENTPENIRMLEDLKKQQGTNTAVSQRNKCPVCHSWITKKARGVCTVCYMKNRGE